MSVALLRLTGDLFDLIGTILIAYAALSVHHRFRHEHKVDEVVFKAMSMEIKLGFVGIVLILSGFIIKVMVDFALI